MEYHHIVVIKLDTPEGVDKSLGEHLLLDDYDRESGEFSTEDLLRKGEWVMYLSEERKADAPNLPPELAGAVKGAMAMQSRYLGELLPSSADIREESTE